MMMPSPTHCSVEKPHNSSKKILFPEKTTRSANAIRFHCRSRTVSHCIKGKAFLKTRHMSRPDILLDRNHDVGAGRSLSSNQSQWHRSHTVVCSMSSSLNKHIQCNGAYSRTLIQWYICHTVVCSMSHSWGLSSHTFPSLSEAGSRKSQFWAKEASTDTFPMSFLHFPAIIKFH